MSCDHPFVSFGSSDLYTRHDAAWRVETGTCNECGATLKSVWTLVADVESADLVNDTMQLTDTTAIDTVYDDG